MSNLKRDPFLFRRYAPVVATFIAAIMTVACGGSAENERGNGPMTADDGTGMSTGGASDDTSSGGSPSGMDGGSGGLENAGVGGPPESAPDCDALDRARVEAFDAARTCDLDGDIEAQCDGGASVPDQCNCGRLANALAPDLLQAAHDAREAWSSVCGMPEECGDCPPSPPGLPTCRGDSLCTY